MRNVDSCGVYFSLLMLTVREVSMSLAAAAQREWDPSRWAGLPRWMVRHSRLNCALFAFATDAYLCTDVLTPEELDALCKLLDNPLILRPFVEPSKPATLADALRFVDEQSQRADLGSTPEGEHFFERAGECETSECTCALSWKFS